MNASMVSVQEIHKRVAKHLKIPASWRSKNYTFEFIECISTAVTSEILNEIRELPFHTLITDESSNITVSKMFISHTSNSEELEVIFIKLFFLAL